MMLDLQVEKLLLILMEDGEGMEEELSLEKMQPKLIGLELMLQDGLPKIWFSMDSVRDVWFKLLMQLVLPNL